jgi:hypothetical protein
VEIYFPCAAAPHKLLIWQPHFADTMAESKLPMRFILILSLLLIVTAIAFWVVWGVTYDGWNIFSSTYMGVYAIVVTLLAFGLLGLALFKLKSKTEVAKK